jgi:1-acyl-sn-glycerol-3-phosphate acyltransferase
MKSDPEYKLPPRLPQKSWLYSLVKQWVKLIIPVFFKEIVVEGQENIPASCAVILAPNHQNSFLDAVVTLCFLPRTCQCF